MPDPDQIEDFLATKIAQAVQVSPDDTLLGFLDVDGETQQAVLDALRSRPTIVSINAHLRRYPALTGYGLSGTAATTPSGPGRSGNPPSPSTPDAPSSPCASSNPHHPTPANSTLAASPPSSAASASPPHNSPTPAFAASGGRKKTGGSCNSGATPIPERENLRGWQRLSFDEKLQANEELNELANDLFARRKAKGLPYIDPDTGEPGILGAPKMPLFSGFRD
ncbi:MAG: hypothetical protein ACLFSZ_08925 [Puniceicoccaceae bacterium]